MCGGARTVSSDRERRYINVPRYLLYLEQSIKRGTQWVAFKPNGEPLWNRGRQMVEAFLHYEFQAGALPGEKPDEAYFVRCDRSTMTQYHFEIGHLICEIGVAPLKPAEIVIFRIGRKTLALQS